MPSRNCEKRPVSWRISYNKELAEVSAEVGFEAWAFFIGCIASRDNLGRLEGDEYQLKGMFFPKERYPQVTVEKVVEICSALAEKDLIIVYEVKGIKYILLPKTSEYSDIVGNMSATSDYPDPPMDVIKAWEERANAVYTPSKRKLSEGQGKGQGKGLKKKRSLEKKDFKTPILKTVLDEYRRKFKNDAALVKHQLLKDGYAEVEIDKALGRF